MSLKQYGNMEYIRQMREYGKVKLNPSYLHFGCDVTASFVVNIKVANAREKILHSLHARVHDVKMRCNVTLRLGMKRSYNLVLFVAQY